jgi:hypothetical protein
VWDWDDAAAAIARCRGIAEGMGLDMLYGIYAERISRLRERPPSSDWDVTELSLET